MGVDIVRMDKNGKYLQKFGYMDYLETKEIIDVSKKISLRSLKYLDQFDDAFFNSKQLKYVLLDLELLEKQSLINQDLISMMRDATIETQKYPDQFLAFVGD